ISSTASRRWNAARRSTTSSTWRAGISLTWGLHGVYTPSALPRGSGWRAMNRGLSKPLDRRHFVADARQCLCQRFDLDLHVERVGMQKPFGVEHDADMARPEHDVAAPAWVDRAFPAKRILLHVGVARCGDARAGERSLHQPRTIHSGMGLAAPDIRRADKAFRRFHPVGGRALDGCQMS